MSSVRITAVSYLNTLPFIYGIEQQVGAASPAPGVSQQDAIVLSLKVPAACAQAALDGTTDIALVPVAIIPLLPAIRPREIITDYCIGAEGIVETVVLLANSPVSALHTIYLDAHSRTSAQLARVLAHEWWHIAPRWVDHAEVEHLQLTAGEGLVAIGDKTFDLRERYTHRYDLSQEWSRLTGGLPFVFAAWIACSEAGLAFAPRLNQALAYGTEHIAQAITDTRNRNQEFDFTTAHRYLTEHIKFNLDPPKRRALALFWEKTITPG